MESVTSDLGSRTLAALSIGSGALMLVFPQRMARVYAMPHSCALIRSLGLRDILVGAAMLNPKQRTWGALSRAVSDLVDLGLIVAEARKKEGGLATVLGRAGGALLSATVSLWLSDQLRREPSATAAS